MAFPSNATVLDNFNRADQTPIGAPWAASKIQGGTQDLKIVTSLLGANATSGNGYLSSAHGPGVEMALTVVDIVGTYDALWLLTSGEGTATWSGYFLVHEYLVGADSWRIRKRVAPGSAVDIATNAAGPDVAANDSLGLEVTSGGVITGYHKPAGGAWASVVSITDTDLGSTGRIAFETEVTSARYDNLTGGSIVAATGGSHGLLLLGVGA